MGDKKKDLIPILAIALFLVIIIILCVVRLGERKKNESRQDAAVSESVEMIYAQEATAESGEVSLERKESASVASEEESTETETESQTVSTQEESVENQLPAGKEKTDNQKTGTGVRTISGNDPLAAAEGVNKTNEEMLMEMSGYWEQDNMEAVRDLAHLAWFMKMSASIADEDTFYYYGERNAQGQPEGTGIACYADNEYYYGQWSQGKREGTGEWVKYYVYYDDDTVSDRAYTLHMYMGEWAGDLPNGSGQEHYELDLSQAAKKDRYLQNVIGSFQDGMYSGEMYLTTLNWDGNQEEWNGMAEGGVWSPYGAATNKKEVPVCQDVDDDANYLWILVRNNKDRGIDELMP